MPVGRFPFGAPSTARPPRTPSGPARAVVLGVYPSALHVRWTLPKSRPDGLPAVVGALAVADEPTVFWDGADEQDRLARWMAEVGFRTGDGPEDHGYVTAGGNGTSGRPVRDRVLTPLGIDVADVWFTDSIDRFFVKHGSDNRPQQGDVIRTVYDPFARARAGLEPAALPRRPSPERLVNDAVTEHRDRLRDELLTANAPVVITLGEEARQVLAAIVDTCSGAPLTALTTGPAIDAAYGRPGTAAVDDLSMRWYALAHPGNRAKYWTDLHTGWATRR